MNRSEEIEMRNEGMRGKIKLCTFADEWPKSLLYIIKQDRFLKMMVQT